MKKVVYTIGLIGIGMIFLSSSLFAQSSDNFVNSMVDQIDNYYREKPRDNVYLHTDRSVYFSGEEILFRLVANEAANLAPSERSNKCAITLMDARGVQVISTTISFEKGFAFGSFKLPDNLNQGRYNLFGYTMIDNMITSNKVFNKDIIITNPSGQLMIDYTFDKDFYLSAQSLVLTFKAYSFKSKPQAKLNIKYKLSVNDEVLATGSGKTDKEGSYSLTYQLPENLPNEMIVEVDAVKSKIKQKMYITVPFAKPVSQNVKTGVSNGIQINVKDVGNNKIQFGLAYSESKIKADKKVIIALFRKGLLYWSAPGQVGQASDITVPISRIPSGIINVVVFDPEGSVMAEKMVYYQRENMPSIDLSLNKNSFNQRQEVIVDVNFTGNIISIPKETNLSVSVVPKDMMPLDELLLDDHMLIDVDLQQDSREFLIMDRNSEDRSKIIQRFLDNADRNGYSWQQILHPGEEIPRELDPEELADDLNVLYFPSYFNAAKMKDYSQGIKDKRHPNATQQNYKRQLESGMSVLEVVKTIKPYTMYGNKIIFAGKLNSLVAQQGALIVIDNQIMGTNATVLNSISPSDVESINVSTNSADVQKYTAQNSVGLVEVNLKGYGPGSRISDESSRDDLVRDSNGKYLPGYPDYSLEKDARSVIVDYRTLLFWEPMLQADEEGKMQFKFYSSDMPGTYIITVQGMLGAQPVAVRKEFTVH